MGRLLVLLFLLPWWAYIPASLGVLWLGERVYEQALETEAERAAALETAMPARVDLGSFDMSRDIHVSEEVHVTGWINSELNYELVKRRNGVPTSKRYMYMMFGSQEPHGEPEVRAALMLTGKQRDIFIERIDDFIVGFTDESEYVLAFNGFADTSVTMGGMAADAIDDEGLRKAENFVFIEPFLEGREAALAPRGLPRQTRQIGWLVAAVAALIGVVKRVMSVRKRPSRAETEAEAVAGDGATDGLADPAPADPPSLGLPNTVSPDSPLGRIALRRLGHAPAPESDFDATGPEMAPEIEPQMAPQTDMSLDAPEARDHGAERAQENRSAARLIFDSALADDSDIDGQAAEPGAKAGNWKSGLAFYVWLGLAMLAVGVIAYRPSIVESALPFAAVALFWLVVFVAYQSFRNRARTAGPGRGIPFGAKRGADRSRPTEVRT